MTIKELIQALNTIVERDGLSPDTTVEIRTMDPSVGPCSGVPVAAACAGFDWNSGRCFLQPKEFLIKKTMEPR